MPKNIEIIVNIFELVLEEEQRHGCNSTSGRFFLHVLVIDEHLKHVKRGWPYHTPVCIVHNLPYCTIIWGVLVHYRKYMAYGIYLYHNRGVLVHCRKYIWHIPATMYQNPPYSASPHRPCQEETWSGHKRSTHITDTTTYRLNVHCATLFSRRIILKIFQTRNLEASSLSAPGGVLAASEVGRAVEEGGGQAWLRLQARLRLQLRAEQVPPFFLQFFLGHFLRCANIMQNATSMAGAVFPRANW